MADDLKKTEPGKSEEVEPREILFQAALHYLDKKMRSLEMGLAGYTSKNKNPFKQLWHRAISPGAMRRDRKKMETEVVSIRAMLDDVTAKLVALPLSNETPSPQPTSHLDFSLANQSLPETARLQKHRRLIFLGAAPRVEITKGIAPQEFLKKCGRNTGNLMITHSLARELRYEKANFYGLGGHSTLETSDADLLVYPASNFLNPHYDFSSAVKFLERVQLPCLMVGLGAQSKGDGDALRALPESTRRFIEIISERSDTIGVRGLYTADLLAGMGVKNVEVIGCPSFYAHCQPQFPIREKIQKPLSKIALHGSRQVVKLAFNAERMRAVEDALLHDALRYEATFITQNGWEETSLALYPASLADWQLEALTDYHQGCSAEKVRRFFRKSNRIYGDIDQWRTDLASFDFVIGTRFHGNIVALQAGVPAFLLVHDRRTQELAELLHLPHRHISDSLFQSPTQLDIQKLYDEADFAPTQRAYAALYPKYKALLERAGVGHCLE